MKNINELRENLCKLFDGLKNGEIEAKHAKEMNNAAGKIIGSLKVELEYADLCKIKPSIKFLDSSE